MKSLVLLSVLLCSAAFASEKSCGPNADQPNNPYVPHFKCPVHRVVRTTCHKDKKGDTVCESRESYEQE